MITPFKKTKTIVLILCISSLMFFAQQKQAEKPYRGFMTWNYFGLNISESNIKTLTNTSFTTQDQTLEIIEVKYGGSFI